ncbi:helix-turn-helix domain-containing protein [Nocardia nova]|uniref:helix-turn-helix domain-containing protein n=1 Tax=Nocardia nova TaxID=37330 RepID=UPI0037A5220A
MATNSRRVGAWTRTIASEVRNQRLNRGLEQKDVSAATGIPVNTLSKIERAQTAIDMEQIDLLAAAFKMLPEDLMALARKHDEEREKETRQTEEVYLASGRLNPANTRGRSSSSERVKSVSKRKPAAG